LRSFEQGVKFLLGLVLGFVAGGLAGENLATIGNGPVGGKESEPM
jgi:hypothetical protein